MILEPIAAVSAVGVIDMIPIVEVAKGSKEDGVWLLAVFGAKQAGDE
jgi:hypothetical protein